MSSVQFDALPLAAPLLRALRDKNYITPSPIQMQGIPPAIEGRDILGCAQTGTGKTAAFALPILQRIHDSPRSLRRHEVRSLILTPTRELAVQIADSFQAYGRHLRFRTALVYGGVSQRPQVANLIRGVDVLIATPGRLMDLMEQGYVDLRQVEIFVLDEVDRMLDMGFIRDIRKIAAQLPADRQSLFYSATLEPAITSLAETILRDPVRISVSPPRMTANNIDERICFIDSADKLPLLQDLVTQRMENAETPRTLVFSRTKHGANKLAKRLVSCGIAAEAIHGNKTQAARQRALESFRCGDSQVLVATDVASRGLDVRDITLVINYDLPVEPEAYIHRVGRTARAGADGQAISFCSEDELDQLFAIERLLKRGLEVHTEHRFHASRVQDRHLRRQAGQSSAPRPGFQHGPRGRNGRRSPRPHSRHFTA